MPTQPLDEPVKKITLNIWEADYHALIQSYGPGWSSRVRDIIREHVKTKLTFARGPSKPNLYEGVIGVPGKKLESGFGD